MPNDDDIIVLAGGELLVSSPWLSGVMSLQPAGLFGCSIDFSTSRQSLVNESNDFVAIASIDPVINLKLDIRGVGSELRTGADAKSVIEKLCERLTVRQLMAVVNRKLQARGT